MIHREPEITTSNDRGIVVQMSAVCRHTGDGLVDVGIHATYDCALPAGEPVRWDLMHPAFEPKLQRDVPIDALARKASQPEQARAGILN